MQLSEKKMRLLLGAMAADVIVVSIAGQLILKQNKKMQEVGRSLGKIAAYQNELLQKHVVSTDLDEFDRMVIDDMTKELHEKLKEVGYKPKEEE